MSFGYEFFEEVRIKFMGATDNENINSAVLQHTLIRADGSKTSVDITVNVSYFTAQGEYVKQPFVSGRPTRDTKIVITAETLSESLLTRHVQSACDALEDYLRGEPPVQYALIYAGDVN